MKKILAIAALLAGLLASQANAADTTYVGTSVYTTGDCSPCGVTDSEYYLMTNVIPEDTPLIPSIPMAVLDDRTGASVPFLIVPEAITSPAISSTFGYLGPVADNTTNSSDSIWMYSVYQQPTNVDVGGFGVNVLPDNRFRLINHHYIPSRESAMVPVDSTRNLNPFRPTLPNSFATGVKER